MVSWMAVGGISRNRREILRGEIFTYTIILQHFTKKDAAKHGNFPGEFCA